MDQHRHIRHRFKLSGHVGEHTSYPMIGVRGGRDRLAEVFNEFGYKTGVEIGTCKGAFALVLCKAIPGLALTCVDPWLEYLPNRNPVTQAQQELNYAEATTVLAPYGVTILRQSSMEAVANIPDNSLDFVYIDGDHQFDFVMMDILCWTKKVRAGGVLAGHDYFWFPDVARAAQAYTDCHASVHPWYVLREHMGGTFFWIVQK